MQTLQRKLNKKFSIDYWLQNLLLLILKGRKKCEKRFTEEKVRIGIVSA